MILSMAEYVDRIVDFTSTPNGVFGTKLHWTMCDALRCALQSSLGTRLVDVQRRSLDELLHAKFMTVHYIWLRRKNKIAQGISHFRAIRTKRWTIAQRQCNDPVADNRDPVEFDFRMIDDCVGWANEHDSQWQTFFERHQLRPLILHYEDFIAAYDPVLRDVLQFIGLPHDDLTMMKPPLERMADARSIEWEALYRQMKVK